MLSDLLKADAANPKGVQFDLGFWTAPTSDLSGWQTSALKFDEDLAERTYNGNYAILPQENLPKVTCGTTACAMGLAMISKQFEQFGLKTVYYSRGDKAIVLLPSCGGEEGFEAAANLFGISLEDAQYLFDPDYYDETPKEAEGELFVAQRIDDFVNGIVDRDCYPSSRDDEDEDEASDD
jgi:hypothetical protein